MERIKATLEPLLKDTPEIDTSALGTLCYMYVPNTLSYLPLKRGHPSI